MSLTLVSIYKKLYSHFGAQHWWPAKSPFEVIVGAILTQSTSWKNVEKAITNLKKNRVLAPDKLYRLSEKRLAFLIRPSGYYNIKSRRLKEFLRFLFGSYQGSLSKLSSLEIKDLRARLLSVKGIGPETADSILLYALNKPVFVVDAYTRRFLLRHRFITERSDYEKIQNLFMKNMKTDVKLFNEYHALLVRLGKEFCLKNKPKCKICPLNSKRKTQNARL